VGKNERRWFIIMIETLHTTLIQAEAELSLALKAYSFNKISIAKEKRWIELEQMAKAAVIKVGEETQREIKQYIEDSVTFALQTVYGSQYHFVTDFRYDKRDQAEVKFFLSRNGKLYEPRKDTISGGATDICAFSLRMVLYTLEDPDPAPILILDEPFKNVSKGYMPFVSEMVKELANMLNLQLIISTHTDEIIELADNIIYL
jgi:DNA repair exonuclease SbcCD ATPase subunit